MSEKASKLTHTGDIFHTQPASELAKRVVENSFASKVFFTNSGTEAAIKFARKYAALRKGLDPYVPQVHHLHNPIKECLLGSWSF